MNRILIIRTEPAAGEMVARLRAFGWEAVALPLLRVRPLVLAPGDEKQLQGGGRFDVVVVVSAHAARLFLQIGGTGAIGACWLAVGKATAAPLIAAGIACRTPDQPLGSEALLALPELDEAQITGRKVLLLQGDNARTLLADRLQERGAVVEAVSLYAREKNPLSEQIIKETLAAPWSLAVIGSGELLRALAAHRNLIAQTWPILAPSSRIADLAAEYGFNQVFTLESGDLNADAVHHWLNDSSVRH